MWANVLGIPLFVVIFLATDHYLHELDFIGDRLAINALGVCLGLIGYFAAKGIDTIIYEKRDNPEPFTSDKTVPEVFGIIKESLSESSFGPFHWNLKTIDQEASRIVATFTFTEQLGTPLTPMQATRLVMLQVLVDPIPDEEQKPSSDEEQKTTVPGMPERAKPLTKIQMQWLIDSPLNRTTVNRIQDDSTKGLKVMLGLIPPDDNKKANPFAPPDWVVVLLVLAICFAAQRMDQYTAFKAQRAEQLKAAEQERVNRQAEQQAAQQKALQAQAEREAYSRQMEEKFLQGKLEQQRRAEELRQQQLNQSPSYAPLYTPPLQNNSFAPPLGTPSGSLIQSPFHLQPSQSNTNPVKPWRAGQ